MPTPRRVEQAGEQAGGVALRSVRRQRQRHATLGGEALRRVVAVHDIALRRTHLFGGYQRQVWALVEPDAAAFLPFGDGCARRPARPLLQAHGGDRPFLGAVFEIEGVGMSSSPFAFLLLGDSDHDWFGLPLPYDLTAIGMTECRLLVRPDATLPLLVIAGRTRGQLSVPASPGLLGSSFYLQILQNEEFANPLGAVLSNGARCVIGLR